MKTKSRDGNNFWTQQRKMMKEWWIFMTDQLLPFIGCTPVKLWVSRDPVCLFACQGGRVTMDTLSSLYGHVLCMLWPTLWMWSHCWFDGKIGISQHSKLQSIPVLSPFIEGVLTFEFSDFCFCSTFCRRGMWDLGRSKDLFIMQTPVCSPDLLK